MASATFTSSGTFTVPAGVTSVDVLVVAGGGGGGANWGGGGGGATTSVSNSSSGGSGGGGQGAGSSGPGSAGTGGQGSAGGSGTGSSYGGGGGGGYSGGGANASGVTTSSSAGNGGSGYSYGGTDYASGGGGGLSGSSGSVGAAGGASAGAGGYASDFVTAVNGANAPANLGGGGGGGNGAPGNGGSGGSGIVIVTYIAPNPVDGPGSSIDGDIALFDGTTGALIKDSGLKTSAFATPAAAVLPTGGAKFQRLAKNSATNYATGWYGPDSFNVLDYGAGLGSGSATAITAAINAAISDLNAAGGGTLRIPCNPYPGSNGVYNLNSALTIISVPCAIIGDGFGISAIGGTCLLQGTANTTVLKIATASPCTISNVAFNGGGTLPTVTLAGSAPAPWGGILPPTWVLHTTYAAGSYAISGAVPGQVYHTAGGDINSASDPSVNGNWVPVYYNFNSSSIIRECAFIGGDTGLSTDAAFLTIRDSEFAGTTYGINCINSFNLDEFVGLITGCSISGGTAGLTATADGIQVIGNSFNGGTYGVIFKCTNTVASPSIAARSRSYNARSLTRVLIRLTWSSRRRRAASKASRIAM